MPLLDELEFPYRNLRVLNRDQRLEVSNAQVEDAGRYQCTVTNVAGQQEKQFNLVVHGKSHSDVWGRGGYRDLRYPMPRFNEDAGKYQCTVTNVACQQEKQFNLVVRGESHSERSKVKVIMGKYENYLVNMINIKLLSVFCSNLVKVVRVMRAG